MNIEMNSLRKLPIIFLCTIIIVNGESWYSATLVDNQSPKESTKINEYRNNFIRDSGLKFMPLDIAIDRRLLESDSFHYAETKSTDSIPTSSNPSFADSDTKMFKTNTITNNNELSRMRLAEKNSQIRYPVFETKIKQSNQTSRFLEVFELVEFEHVTCTSSSGLEGTCLHEYECQAAGGSNMGTCADGYGTCCVNQFLCDNRYAARMGWFTNPEFPSPSTDRLSCAVTLEKAAEDITQIRLDFTSFELLPPIAGVCQEDQFVVSGQNVNNIIPILCGINTGQHVYIEVGDVEGPIYLSIQTISSESRLFCIKVTQLTSADKLASPPGCLQYFVHLQGYLKSFNYGDKSDIAIPRASGYLNNLNYALCIKRGSESCSVTYTNVGHMQIVNYDTDSLPVIPPGQAGVEIFNCPSDWLLISATRLCGDRLNDGSVLQDFSLNAPITDNSAGPIIVWFRSDEGYVGRGFKLQYQQNTCRKPT